MISDAVPENPDYALTTQDGEARSVIELWVEDSQKVEHR